MEEEPKGQALDSKSAYLQDGNGPREVGTLDNGQHHASNGAIHNIVLLLESANDTVECIRELSRSLDESLQQGADLDTIIKVLEAKKARVDVMRDLATEIRVQLRVDASGQIGVQLPEAFRLRFGQLMSGLQQILEEEARLESLICGRGLTISKR